jgi:hypothetical protein
MTRGGRRRGRGRKPRDTVPVACALLRPVYLELVRLEKESGVYRTRIVAGYETK